MKRKALVSKEAGAFAFEGQAFKLFKKAEFLSELKA